MILSIETLEQCDGPSIAGRCEGKKLKSLQTCELSVASLCKLKTLQPKDRLCAVFLFEEFLGSELGCCLLNFLTE